jgi:hypothetical protein
MIFRPLSILLPRLTQVIGWTFDPSNLQRPLLSPEEIHQLKEDMNKKIRKVTLVYMPPTYQPPRKYFQN